jgi:hypothetical protein
MEENKNIPLKQTAENIPEVENKEISTSNEETISSEENVLPEIEQSEIPPSSGTAIIETINTAKENNMEVHHHTHASHGKKNWKAYFWEFLMLFLAVFCGFLAEYQLEHKIERDREKEYAKALYDEFYADSIVFTNKITGRLGKEKDCDYLVSYIRDSSLTNLPRDFYPAYTVVMYLITSYTFEPKDGILNQLKGSGSLRYFKSASLQKLFGEIGVYINNVRDRNDQEYQFFASPVKQFILKHYDFNWMNELRKLDETGYNMELIARYRAGNNTIKADILNLPSFNKGEVINMILFYKQMLVSTRTLAMKDYMTANKKLLQELRKEYHLE